MDCSHALVVSLKGKLYQLRMLLLQDLSGKTVSFSTGQEGIVGGVGLAAAAEKGETQQCQGRLRQPSVSVRFDQLIAGKQADD